MRKLYPIGLEKWYKSMIWLNKNQNHLLWCQNDVVISFLERVNQGESLVNWLTEPPAVCWSLIMGDLSPSCKGVYWTRPEVFKTGPPSCPVQGMWWRHQVIDSIWLWIFLFYSHLEQCSPIIALVYLAVMRPICITLLHKRKPCTLDRFWINCLCIEQMLFVPPWGAKTMQQ